MNRNFQTVLMVSWSAMSEITLTKVLRLKEEIPTIALEPKSEKTIPDNVFEQTCKIKFDRV